MCDQEEPKQSCYGGPSPMSQAIFRLFLQIRLWINHNPVDYEMFILYLSEKGTQRL